MLANKSALTCCGKYIPFETIRKYCVLPSKGLEDCCDWYEELTDPSPVYCANQSCGKFVSARCVEGTDAICPYCSQETCIPCRQKSHDYLCVEDPTLKKYRMKYRWQICPHCKATVERTEGCKVISCRCGRAFCYRCGISLETLYCDC